MDKNRSRLTYVPGTYARKRPDPARLVSQYVDEWSQRLLKMKGQQAGPVEVAPAICFSRKIGGGALEIADLLAEKLLHDIDQEQRRFFKKAFGKKDASPYEFDLVINSDFLTGPRAAAKLVAQAFSEKFAAELKGKPLAGKAAA